MRRRLVVEGEESESWSEDDRPLPLPPPLLPFPLFSPEHIPPALTPPSPASSPTDSPMALCLRALLVLLWRGTVLPFRAWVGEGLLGVPDPVGLPPALAVSAALCASLMTSSSSTGPSTTALKRRFTRAAPIVCYMALLSYGEDLNNSIFLTVPWFDC